MFISSSATSGSASSTCDRRCQRWSLIRIQEERDDECARVCRCRSSEQGQKQHCFHAAQDDRVEIAPDPGTTTHSRCFPMRVDGRVLYTLVDTPGFQRPRDVLRWLQQHETSVVDHPTLVQRFVEQHASTSQYDAECRLLQPIIAGGGILYVVDGSVPFGSEYEPEMEILRWTGRSSMALINPIGQERYIEQWEAALGQYFKIVRVFNAMTAEFEKRLELLRAFGQLHEDWRQPMEVAVTDLVNERTRQRHRAAEVIARMLIEMMTLTVAKTIPPQADAKAYYGALERSTSSAGPGAYKSEPSARDLSTLSGTA